MRPGAGCRVPSSSRPLRIGLERDHRIAPARTPSARSGATTAAAAPPRARPAARSASPGALAPRRVAQRHVGQHERGRSDSAMRAPPRTTRSRPVAALTRVLDRADQRIDVDRRYRDDDADGHRQQQRRRRRRGSSRRCAWGGFYPADQPHSVGLRLPRVGSAWRRLIARLPVRRMARRRGRHSPNDGRSLGPNAIGLSFARSDLSPRHKRALRSA